MEEYKLLIEAVNGFDERLMVIKGWAVTFTLATLVVAIQKRSSQVVWVVILSAACFWILEAEMKYHQSSYYPRMRAFEINMANLQPTEKLGCYETKNKEPITTVLIDWSWENPKKALTNKICVREPVKRLAPYMYLHVMLPHALIILACGIWLASRARAKASESANK